MLGGTGYSGAYVPAPWQPADRAPQLIDGTQRRPMAGSTVLARPDGRRHLLIPDAELPVLELLDGAIGQDGLVARFGPAAAELVDDLARSGFLVGVPGEEDPRLTVSVAGIEFAGFDRVIGRIGGAGGHKLVSWPGAAIAAFIGAVGLALLVATRGWATHGLADAGAVVAVWCLVLTHIPAGLIHESAHALVINRHGRRVGRAGFGFYWGGLSFFVDATDALMLKRRYRMAQALAGPAADLTIAGALATAAFSVGPGQLGSLLRILAVVAYLELAINLAPLLQLDGYWFLADGLDEPDLRRRSLQALRHPFTATSRRNRLLALYAAGSLAFGAALIASGLIIWINELGPLTRDAFQTSWLGAIGGGLLVAPLVLGGTAQLVHLAARGFPRVGRPDDRKGVISYEANQPAH
jgi:hypothetical protein